MSSLYEIRGLVEMEMEIDVTSFDIMKVLPTQSGLY